MKEETRSAMAEMQAKERKKRMMRALSQARQELMREIREKEKLVKNSRGRTAGKRRMRTAADAMSAQERMALTGEDFGMPFGVGDAEQWQAFLTQGRR